MKLRNSLTGAGLAFMMATGFAATPFSPYGDVTLWNNQAGSIEGSQLASIAEQNAIKGYHLAFIVDSGNCQPSWGGSYPLDESWAVKMAQDLKAQNVNTVVSFGGQLGNDLSASCSPHAMSDILMSVTNDYHVSGLDFDIENGTANVDTVIQALSLYQVQSPQTRLSFTLPVMPEGLTPQGLTIITKARDAGLNFNVNIMAMDYGGAYSGDMGEYAIQAATNLHQSLKTLYPNASDAELWAKIEVTPMIGLNDVTVEKFTLANADRLKQFADEKGFAGLSMWSISRDKPCANQWVSSTCSSQNLQSHDYEYTKHFQA